MCVCVCEIVQLTRALGHVPKWTPPLLSSSIVTLARERERESSRLFPCVAIGRRPPEMMECQAFLRSSYTHTHTRTHAHKRTRTHARTHTHAHTNARAHTRTCTHVHTRAHPHSEHGVRTCIGIHTYTPYIPTIISSSLCFTGLLSGTHLLTHG